MLLKYDQTLRIYHNENVYLGFTAYQLFKLLTNGNIDEV